MAVDARGRISVPASFRSELGPGEDSVFLWPSLDPHEACLVGGGRKLLNSLKRALDRLKPLDPRTQALKHAIFGRGRFCALDANGRIVVDEALMQAAGISLSDGEAGEAGGRVVFVGLGDRFQIWGLDAYQRGEAERRQLANDSVHLLEAFGDEEAA